MPDAQIIRFPVERRVAQIVAAGGTAPLLAGSPPATEGIHYRRTAHLDVREIAALIRRDLKNDSLLREACVISSVRLHRFSGGCSIGVALAAKGALDAHGRETPLGKAIRSHAESIRQSYGYDRSDVLVDYSDVRYYGRTEWA